MIKIFLTFLFYSFCATVFASSPTISSCAGTTAGLQTYDSSLALMKVCDGTNWKNLKGDSNGSCAGTTAGTQRYNSSDGVPQFCDGTSWYNMISGGSVGSTYIFKVWGAGGGASNRLSSSQGSGGLGGNFVQATLSFSNDLKIVVGSGGGTATGGANGVAGTYGGGGTGNYDVNNHPGAGGGYSGVFDTSVAYANALLVAGGGGAGSCTTTPGGYGGNASGGGTVPGELTGGIGTGASGSGGGGGGGYLGGQAGFTYNYAGASGTNFTSGTSTSTASGANPSGATGGAAGNAGDGNYAGSAGMGGARAGANGYSGRVVILESDGTTIAQTYSTAGIYDFSGSGGATPVSSCAGTTTGTQRYTSGDLQYCNGTNWYSMISNYVRPPEETLDFFSDSSGVALYMFDGNGDDESGTYNSSPNSITYSTGQIGQAVDFSGGGNVTISSNLGLTGTVTFSYWVKFNSFPTRTAMMVNTGTSGDTTIFRMVSDNSTPALHNMQTVNMSSSQSLSTGTWYHLAYSRSSGGTVKLYIDGVERASSTHAGWNTAKTWKLGAEQEDLNGTFPMNGLIDQLRVFNRALSLSEINEIYDAEK